MTPERFRVLASLSVAAAAIVVAAALRLQAPGDASRAETVPSRWLRTDTLGRGEALAEVLVRLGLSGAEAGLALAAASQLDFRRLREGLEVRASGDTSVSAPTDLVLVLAPDRTLRITRDSAGWGAREERIPWTTDTIVVRGVVRSNLYDAIDSGAVSLLTRQARAELAWVLADIYEYRVDMSRDLHAGDAVRVVFERSRLPNGTARIGTVIAAGLERGGREVEAVRFVPSDGTRAEFFDREGRSLRAAFLRAPLQFRRISSGFGRRLHPILGVWRAHRGTDYAASSGTPVRSIGEGTVVSAGLSGGYGQAIDVRHPNGFVSRYGHLRGFASGIRRGARVAMGETIGYVGATGMATAPHLHFEILVGGVQRDPRRALTERAGAPLASGDRAAFARALAAADAAFAGRTGGKATADSAP